MKKASPEPSPNKRSWVSINARMASAHDPIEATISSFMSAAGVRRNRGSAVTVRTTQSVALRTTGRIAENFCRAVICLPSAPAFGDRSVGSNAALTTRESPSSAAAIMSCSPSPENRPTKLIIESATVCHRFTAHLMTIAERVWARGHTCLPQLGICWKIPAAPGTNATVENYPEVLEPRRNR